MAGDTGKTEGGALCTICGKRRGTRDLECDGKWVLVCDRCWQQEQWKRENGRKEKEKYLCARCGGLNAFFIEHRPGEGEKVFCAKCRKDPNRWKGMK